MEGHGWQGRAGQGRQMGSRQGRFRESGSQGQCVRRKGLRLWRAGRWPVWKAWFFACKGGGDGSRFVFWSVGRERAGGRERERKREREGGREREKRGARRSGCCRGPLICSESAGGIISVLVECVAEEGVVGWGLLTLCILWPEKCRHRAQRGGSEGWMMGHATRIVNKEQCKVAVWRAARLFGQLCMNGVKVQESSIGRGCHPARTIHH